MPDDLPKVPTYADLLKKIRDLEENNRDIEERYKLLVQKIKKEAIKKVDDPDKFLRNYARDVDSFYE